MRSVLFEEKIKDVSSFVVGDGLAAHGLWSSGAGNEIESRCQKVEADANANANDDAGDARGDADDGVATRRS